MDAINSKYNPIQKSAIARLHIKNLDTVISDSLKTTTNITAKLPTKANSTTHQTDILSQDAPMISSQGFKAFGSGWHSTSGALKNINNIMYLCIFIQLRAI